MIFAKSSVTENYGKVQKVI